MDKITSKLFLLLTIGALLLGFGQFRFVRAAAHAAGTNISSNGTVYIITDDGQRRAYTSAGAFLSYGFNSWAMVQPATPEDMALPQGSFIPPRDGKIVCSDRGSDKGTCYLITNGKRAAFVSAQVFNNLGFSFSKTLTGDVSFLEKDNDISDFTSQHLPGVLINKNGTVYLVGTGGLLGVPSMDVLQTWGYSINDAVPANQNDSQLPQSAVIASRQGAQLMPNAAPANSASESSLVQGYIDTYPDLPTTTVSAPQDGAQVIDLVKKLENITDPSITASYPYMTAQSVEMLNSAASLKTYLDSPQVHLIGMSPWNSNIVVYTGATQALYTETNIQQQTSYKYNYYWVCKKENGAWKFDLIGTIKYENEISSQNNPSNAYTTGTGTDNITIETAYFTENPIVGDLSTWLIVEVKNSGQTAIKKFGLLVHFNNIVVADETDSYELGPNQSAYLAVPISSYWSLNSARTLAGQYTADVRVNLGQSTNETFVADNTYTVTGNFQQKPAPVVNNLVGTQ